MQRRRAVRSGGGVSQTTIQIHNDSVLKRMPRRLMAEAVKQTLRTHNVHAASVSIVVINDRAIRRMNRQYLDHDYATDVLSFSLSDSEVDGEIYISAQTARQQAVRYGVSTTNELCRLVIHGVLHLLGHDDADAEQRRRMHELENSLLAKLKWQR